MNEFLKSNLRLPPLIGIWSFSRLAIVVALFLLQGCDMAEKFIHSTADVSPAKRTIEQQFAPTGFSPDSQKLYLEYLGSDQKVKIGWMDLSTKQVNIFVPLDTPDSLASPSSSSDGKQLAIVIKEAASNFEKSQIGVLDLEKNVYRAITTSDSYKQFPSFSRDGKKIIYAQANRRRESGKTLFSRWDIYEVDVNTGTERRLTEFCFFAVSPPFYLEDGERFVFSGEYPACNYPARASKDYLAYSKKYKGNDIFMRRVGEESPLEPLFQNGEYASSAFLTRNGKIFFQSITNEMDGIKGNYNFDIFEYESGVIRRLTNLKTYLSGLVVSPAGDLATYSSDEKRNNHARHWLMKIKEGSHSPLDIGDSKLFSIINVANQARGENK